MRRERAEPAARAAAKRAGRIIALAIAAAPFVLAASQRAAAENSPGAQLAAMCASCHRLDGEDQGIPSIVGLDAKVLSDTMEAFRSGARPSQIMHAVAGSLSAEEVATVVAYLATLQKGSEP